MFVRVFRVVDVVGLSDGVVRLVVVVVVVVVAVVVATVVVVVVVVGHAPFSGTLTTSVHGALTFCSAAQCAVNAGQKTLSTTAAATTTTAIAPGMRCRKSDSLASDVARCGEK